MPLVDVKVVGAGQMKALGKELRLAGVEGKGFKNELLASIRLAAAPGPDAVKESARANLPKSGGLNEYAATSKYAVRTRLTGRYTGVRITGIKNKHGLNRLDAGTARHPVYGNLKVWKSNPVEPGFFTKPLERLQPSVALGVLRAVSRTGKALEDL